MRKKKMKYRFDFNIGSCKSVEWLTLIRGTVKLSGSIVLFVNRNALANSTDETSQ